MNGLTEYLKTSYTAYQAVANAAAFLGQNGFLPLPESGIWELKEGGKYYVVRNGSSLIAFTFGGNGGYKIVASHTDSPCFKLKENAALSDGTFTRLNVEPYGGGIYYTFFDRPLKIAGRIVTEENGALIARGYVGDGIVTIPSLAVHMQRDVNEKFAPDPQTDLLPLLSLGKKELGVAETCVSYDLYAACAESPYESGADGEFLSSPRIDNLTSVYSSLCALAQAGNKGVCIAACLDSEEIGSRTRQGAGGDFLRSVLERISEARNANGGERLRTLSSSFLISLDNAHSVHPNRPEKCDPTNRAVMGGGVVIKGHAGGAYTTDALSSAVIKTIFSRAGVKYQTFYNRSNMRSGGTLGSISLGQASIPSVDLGIAQLAMHSAVETMCKADHAELEHGLQAFYQSEIVIDGDCVTVR